MKPLTKWLLGILIGLVVIVGGIFIWKELKPKTTSKTTATQISTADWKTYTNSSYGFSFKYPKDWVADDSKTTFPNTLLNVNLDLIGKGQKNQDTDYPGMASINLYESINKLDNRNLTPVSLKDYLDKYAVLADPVYSNVTAETIGGLNGYTAKMGTNQLGGGSTYFVKLNNGNILEFRTFNTGITTDQIANILSTFQFTTASTADWKTYTNNTYGFSFKYPPKLIGETTSLEEITTKDFNGFPGIFHVAIKPEESWQDVFFDVTISDMTIDQRVQELQSESNVSSVTKEITAIGKESGYKIIINQTGISNDVIHYYTYKGSNEYGFYGWPNPQTGPFQSDWDQILSTFQFIK